MDIHDKLDILAGSLKQALVKIYGREMGFALLIFEFGYADRAGHYVSNAKRKDMIELLRETANRIEKNEIIGRPEGSA